MLSGGTSSQASAQGQKRMRRHGHTLLANRQPAGRQVPWQQQIKQQTASLLSNPLPPSLPSLQSIYTVHHVSCCPLSLFSPSLPCLCPSPGCARTSSDRFFLAASHYGRSWSSSMVDTEQRHLLLTHHQCAERMHKAGALSNALCARITTRYRPAEELSASGSFYR